MQGLERLLVVEMRLMVMRVRGRSLKSSGEAFVCSLH